MGVGRIVATLTLAALGATLGAWAGWRAAPALPGDAAAVALVAPAAPGAGVAGRSDRVTIGTQHPLTAWTWLAGTDYNGGAVWLSVDAGADAGAGADRTADRIAAALAGQGWHRAGGAGVVRGRWSLGLTPVPEAGLVIIELGRAEPAPARPLAVLGYLAGLAAGWFAPRRLAARPWLAVRAWSRRAALAGGVLLLPATALTTAGLAGDRELDASPGLNLAVRALGVLGVALLAGAALGVRATPPGRGGPATH
nr:hypothetical protein GCM10020063_004100 [Dactylosporangium thailandense]